MASIGSTRIEFTFISSSSESAKASGSSSSILIGWIGLLDPCLLEESCDFYSGLTVSSMSITMSSVGLVFGCEQTTRILGMASLPREPVRDNYALSSASDDFFSSFSKNFICWSKFLWLSRVASFCFYRLDISSSIGMKPDLCIRRLIRFSSALFS